MKLTKRAYGWPEDAQFLVPDGVRERFDEGIGKRGAELQRRLGAEARPTLRATTGDEIEMMQRRELPDGWDAAIPTFEADEEKGLATRKASNKVENAIAERVPWLISGSADLTDSTSVRLTFDGATNFEPGSFGGRQIHYGIREHAAATACNGMSLCKLRPLWSTYLTFSDYGRPGIRLSALMELPVIHLFTHDSIGLGEDGPTHQPIEQLASLRAMPHLDVIRPGDANEVAEAWRLAIERTHNPVALVLTRQNVPVLDRSRYASAEGVRRGGYVLADCEGEPELILIATGCEVLLARRRPREAGRRGDPLARRQPALLGDLRPPGPGLPRRGAAAGGHRPGRDRGGLDARLGALRRQRGRRSSACTPSASRRRSRTSRRSSGSRRRRSPRWRARSPSARPSNCNDLRRSHDEADRTTARAGPEPLARQHHPDDARRRHARRATSTSSRSPA